VDFRRRYRLGSDGSDVRRRSGANGGPAMKRGTALAVWLLVAIWIGATHLLAAVPPPVIQAILIGLTAILLCLYWKSHLLDWVQDLDIRILILFHVTRFVGFYFLYLYAQGRLPYAFAVPGGWGDIAVAVLALAVASYPAPRIIFAWNVIGLIDILMVVATAVRLNMQNPGSMSALTELPLSLLPTFLVPLIIFLHVVIFSRVRQTSTSMAA
jgi:hypothetical protein